MTYGGQSNTLDLVIEPRLTPSRVPLLNQRWAPLPAGVRVIEERPDIPGGPQFGARWNHIGRVAEYSLSFYNGYDHLPLYRGSVELAPLAVRVQRFYPQMRMYGFDAEVPLPVVTLKAEAAYFSSSGTAADEYALGVIQLEREAGEWSFVAGYAAQAITRRGDAVSFSPVRGSTRAVVGRAGLHDRYRAECRGGGGGAAGWRGNVRQAGVYAGRRTALASHCGVRRDSRAGGRFSRTVSTKFARAVRAAI